MNKELYYCCYCGGYLCSVCKERRCYVYAWFIDSLLVYIGQGTGGRFQQSRKINGTTIKASEANVIIWHRHLTRPEARFIEAHLQKAYFGQADYEKLKGHHAPCGNIFTTSSKAKVLAMGAGHCEVCGVKTLARFCGPNYCAREQIRLKD